MRHIVYMHDTWDYAGYYFFLSINNNNNKKKLKLKRDSLTVHPIHYSLRYVIMILPFKKTTVLIWKVFWFFRCPISY